MTHARLLFVEKWRGLYENKAKLYQFSETELSGEEPLCVPEFAGAVSMIGNRSTWRAGVWMIQGNFLNGQAKMR